MQYFVIPYPDGAGKLLKGERLLLFWSRVAVGDEDACWPWTGADNGLGYGQFQVGGRHMLTHRIALADVTGEIPKGLVIRHKCHNPACCNPAHLHTGTQKENIQDAVLAGRMKRPDASRGGLASAARRREAREAGA
jgi:hypothetical protein